MTQTTDPAPQATVAHWSQHLHAHLAPLSRDRLARLVELIDAEGLIGYADAYRALFPDSLGDPAAKTRSDKAFKGFRDTLCTIAAEQGIALEPRVDQRRKAAPEDRRLWSSPTTTATSA
jgi:hypothetical protein